VKHLIISVADTGQAAPAGLVLFILEYVALPWRHGPDFIVGLGADKCQGT
jgi:hypothetical protein